MTRRDVVERPMMIDTSPATSELFGNGAQHKRKLIEVALPLQAINKASAREKSPQRGRPSTLHLWWARRPLTACRAVLFASLVDDPSSHPELFPTAEDQARERKRLFEIIEQLVERDNGISEHVLHKAQEEVKKSAGGMLPTIYDPFCGGGAIPIEAQRLGLSTLASDLNPVAVLITKALTEIPWAFKEAFPVHPSLRGPLQKRTWERATGLAADVEAYGKWMFAQAHERIGKFYPPIRVDGREATVTTWLWARTVHCPNPLCGAEMPLIKTFVLSTKGTKGWCIEPIVDLKQKKVRYEIHTGSPSRDGTITRRGASCIVCGEPVTLTYIRGEAKAGRMSAELMAIVAEGQRGRTYLPADVDHERIARSAMPQWAPVQPMSTHSQYMAPPRYGMETFDKLFTSRQMLALTAFSDLVRECHDRVLADAAEAGLPSDGIGIESGGQGASAYADAVVTYLAFAVDKLADYNATLCSWHTSEEKIRNVFGRQTLSMAWDFAEANPLSNSSGNFLGAVDLVQRALAAAPAAARVNVFERDATADWTGQPVLICTDPPYYDNVPYADLSDFFYVWLRANLGEIFPNLLAPLLTPKTTELVADVTRFGGDRVRARNFFENGLSRAFRIIRESSLSEYPTTVFYAFKQAQLSVDERNNSQSVERSSIGWEAMLGALLGSGFQIMGTWPMNTELANRQRAHEANALASSIVLACRPRTSAAPRCTRADLLRELRSKLPLDVKRLRDASLAATDLEQAAIGPGMAIFSRYSEVLEPDGKPMSVRSALTLINEELAQILIREIADVDPETHFAISWFDGHYYDEGKFGEADVLLKAKNAQLERLKETGVVKADHGIVRLIRPRELAVSDSQSKIDGALRLMPAWARLAFMIATLTSEDGGEEAAAKMLRAAGLDHGERLKDIAYHCYLICDRAKRSQEAQDFNSLVSAWPNIERLAREDDGTTLF